VDTTGIWANVTSIVAYLVELELFFTIIIIRNMKRNSLASKYLMLSLTIALSMALTLFLSPMILEPSYYDSEMVFVIHIVSGSILTLSIFTLLRGLISIWEQNYRLKVIVEKTTMEEEYYKSIQESLKQISIIRHDYKNHLGIIELLLEKKDYDKAKEYVDKINRETIHATEDLVSSPSPVVSSIVAAKSSVLQEYGGTLNFSSSFGGIFFDDFDVVSILSNILDNAIRAASAADDKDVDLSINQFGDNLMIECTNHFSGTLIKSNGQFLTTKSTDKMLHGLGLESVRQTAAKLHGFVKIQDTHDTFTINVCLPNIMPKQQS
jgi:sensor histidine kinase regulating citrate/malate metabolism